MHHDYSDHKIITRRRLRLYTFSRTALSAGIGLVLIAAGVLLTSPQIAGALVPTSNELYTQLVPGATLFRLGLILLGLFSLAVTRLPVWTHEAGDERTGDVALMTAPLFGVLVVATALRLYQLNAGLWLDEIVTYVLYVRDPFGQIVVTYNSENQHFLYSLLAHLSFVLFGESAWALRLPAVLFGVGSLWALYLLGQEVSSRREAMLATVLLAVSYHHVWFSQNARGYSGLLFWTLLSSWLLVRGLRGASTRTWIWYGVAAALGVYTHMTMLFVIMGQFVVYVAALYVRRHDVDAWPNRWAGLIVGFVLAGLLTFLLHALVVPQILGTIGGTEVSVVSEWKNPLWTVLELARGLRISFAGSIVGLGALVVFAIGVISYARTSPTLLGLLFLPPAIGAGIVIAIGHHLWPRFFFFAAGFGILVVIRGAMRFGDTIVRFVPTVVPARAQLGTVLCAGLILASAASVPFAYGPKQDFDGAYRFIEANAGSGDAIVTVDLTTFIYDRFYEAGWEDVASLETLDQVRAGADTTWLVYTFPPVLKAIHPDIMESIQRDFVVVKTFRGTVANGTVFVCRTINPSANAAAVHTGP